MTDTTDKINNRLQRNVINIQKRKKVIGDYKKAAPTI